MTGKWTQDEKDELVKILTLTMKGQKKYHIETLQDTLAWYKLKLEGRYTVNQIIHAIDLFTDEANEIPRPSDLIKLLNPVAPKITQTEFIHAKEQWAAEGFPSYSNWRSVIKAFEEQECEAREKAQPITDERVKEIINGCTRRLT